jgi:hypothetical protein
LQAHVGTTEKKRTVVPFLYNMDGRIDKLDVIDFPGVDDVNTVPEVTKLLVNLAQVVIFVVDYRYAFPFKLHSPVFYYFSFCMLY